MPAHASTTTAVPKETSMCVRTPAGFPACSRCIPTSPPSNMARTMRISICAANRVESNPNVNSCHKRSINTLLLAPVVRFASLRQSLSKNKREAMESLPVVLRFLYTCVATRNCAECARGSHIRRARRGPDRLPFLAALPPEYQRHLPESGTALRLDQAPRVRPQHPLRQQVIPPPCFPTQR